MILYDIWDRRLINEYYKNTYLFRRKPHQVRQLEAYRAYRDIDRSLERLGINSIARWFNNKFEKYFL